MGKKIISQVKAKISKTSCSDKKPLMNSMIKVLRPKVYIIDSSSFKSLVQELTGNSTVSSPSSSSSSSSSEKMVPVIEVEDDHGNPESSMEYSASFDASVESFRACNGLTLPLDDTNIQSEYMLMNQRESSLVYGDLQAFLELDADEQCFGGLDNVYSEIGQEVSIYDYELSGLI
ncbi:hypothetical protein ERO13_A11G156700v2 [Gossypium hirsutum]|uniref:VQ domain-containing protein n=2 Tax=Gossypium TaxID=3633 RepID=A0A5D2X7V2_GOSMU|nr:hypothetical protein ERO13_A11G156700v2 [Gossypium hirsutum]TYI01102.1 hypothetical protein ES332_A11G178200v1 [Gossypium tomentosum]TYJ09893.1 hypothetical protein E1A91_A11G170500v1 [Gossypium mustelinum]